MAERIGFIGLGIMGGAMAENLLRAGFELFVHNRTAGKTSHLESEGAVVCDSPAAVAAEAQVVCLCLSNDSAVRSVIFGDGGIVQNLRYGSLIIDFSTISPGAAREFGSELSKSYKTAFIDAPVSGGDIGAKNATLSIMAGGASDDFERAKAVFEAVGRKATLTGPVGSGQLTKAVNQLVVAITVAAMTEGLMFADKAGLNLETTLEVISSGAAGSWTLDNYAPRVLAGDLKPGFHARNMLKDLRIAIREADDLGLPLPVSDLLKSLYTGLCAHERPDFELGNHALIELYRNGLMTKSN
ncbi:MAG: NAD(P)-dependent oxidoreductase [Bdellovibrionales bacterium]|nr:NAD(P)-dependent oxidoreductase [Bdellovibrionales bacterium]